MLCEICKKNEATVQTTEVTEKGVKALSLCETCAAERGLSEEVGIVRLGVETNLPAAPGGL